MKFSSVRNAFLSVTVTIIALCVGVFAQSPQPTQGRVGKAANLVRECEDCDGKYDLDNNPSADEARDMNILGFAMKQQNCQFGKPCPFTFTTEGVSLQQVKDWKFGWIKTINPIKERASVHTFSPEVIGGVAIPAEPTKQLKSGYIRLSFAKELVNSAVRFDIGVLSDRVLVNGVWSAGKLRILGNLRLLHDEREGKYGVTHYADSTYASPESGFSMGQLARLNDPNNGADLLFQNQWNDLDVEEVAGTNLVQSSKMIWITLPTQYRLMPAQIIIIAYNASGEVVGIKTLATTCVSQDEYGWAKQFVPQDNQ